MGCRPPDGGYYGWLQRPSISSKSYKQSMALLYRVRFLSFALAPHFLFSCYIKAYSPSCLVELFLDQCP